MNTVLVVVPDEALRARLISGMRDHSVFAAQSDAEALKTLRLIDIDIILRGGPGLSQELEAFIARVKEVSPSALTVAIGAPGDETAAADFALPPTFGQRELEGALRHVTDKLRLTREVAALRSSLMPRGAGAPAGPDQPWEGAAFARVLKEFTRAFAAGFDLPRALEMFLDAIGELVRPTRMALLLPGADAQEYRVATHRGLAPQIVRSVRLSASQGLVRWLAAQGQPARLVDLTEPDVVRELKLLQSVLAVPLLTHGELVGILTVGQPVVGSTYGRGQTETLFDLGSHLATAIRDIAVHNQLEREQQFSERILAHMSSGVITIGRDQRIGTINRRAEQILQLSAADVVKEDLRALPSPLGDMLFDTLRTGRAAGRHEIQLALRGLWLEVSTYPVRGEDGAPLGAVLVFEDLTAQKELLTQKRQVEQTQLLTRVVARIADEIKNPLVSINTFIELIGERYDDPDFRKHFSSVVRRDVRRLVEVFEKLAGLVTEGELNFTTVDVHTVVDDVVTAIELVDDVPTRPLQLDVTRETTPQVVKVDPVHLRKALSYLIWYLAHNSPPDQARVSVSVARHAEREGTEGVRILIGSRTAAVAPEKLHRVFDPVQMVQESLIDVGPAVSQRLVEAVGGQLTVRQGRHELHFLVTLPLAAS
jgi:two-component system, NtrC family, sensor histidine kinase AtoS